ncbi:hypothetical protein K458DRAFT_404606 [Lentithecium fluviatile CBS 122367]|uniref:Uncharacterized protein n=1 Tax=Lentithecium fluviatile CBS 122367 TaxID=1168545 RepID=A0A6G1IZH7_9PLEO|nr:hypothetical protein K458DRAFT_404606 [Lentithecium fluviatile CBS 122367]
MQKNSRRASAASPSQVRRSSRTASRNSVVVSLPPASRPSSRRASTAIKSADFNLDDSNFDWNNPDFLCGFTLDQDIGSGDLPAGYDFGDFAPQDVFGNVFNFGGLPDAARASVSLLQNPFSALPGTPQAMRFINGLPMPMPYYQGAVFTPQFPWNQISPNNQRLQLSGVTEVATSRPYQQMQLGSVTEIAPITPASGQSKRRASKPHTQVQAQAPLFSDGFTGYVGDEQTYDYPDPSQNVLGHIEPYYARDSYHQQGDVALNQPHDPSTQEAASSKRKRLQSPGRGDERQSQSSTHSSARTRNISYRSDSSYPDRSGNSSIGDYRRSASRSEAQKRNLSVVDRPDYFKYAAPKIDTEKPWIRINKTTRGETTRTAKCNDFDPSKFYTLKPHPLGDWSSGRYDFKYTHQGEWKELTMPAAAIRDFILRYPEDEKKNRKLKLNIQAGPTDSARRYLSQTWTKCRFAECPTYRNQTGTILHGHYRVAFDERSFGDPHYDPHLQAGAYVHLYCLERFLDFEFLCQKAHVYVDVRDFPNEPKGKFAASLAGHPEARIALEFVKQAKRAGGDIRSIAGFENYPCHKDCNGKPKPHQDTLVCRMHEAKAATRPPAQIKQFKDRGLSPSHLLVNKGDLELFMAEVMRKKAVGGKAKGKGKRKVVEVFLDDESNDNHDDEYSKKRRRIIEEAKRTFMPSDKKPLVRYSTRKRMSPQVIAEPWDADDSDSDSDFEASHKPSVEGSRRSARAATRNRKDYREVEEPPLRQDQIDCLQGYAPASEFIPQVPNLSANPFAAQQPQQEPDYQAPPTEVNARRRRSSLPLFIDPDLEGADFEALFPNESLNRRASSFASATARRVSILRDSSSRTPSRNNSLGKRHASFSRQPVSHQQEFDTEAPPRDVESPPHTRTQIHARAQERALEQEQKVKEKEKEVLGVKGGRVGKKRRSSRHG